MNRKLYFLVMGFLWAWLAAVPLSLMGQTTHVINNQGFTFSPNFLQIQVRDTIDWQIGGSHNAMEVSKASWDMNDNTSNGGFSTPFGGGEVIFTTPGIYYFVCMPHASIGMKGAILVTTATAEDYTAKLTGNQEVWPIVSAASGSVSLVLDDTTLAVSGSFSGMTDKVNTNIAGGAHLHMAYAGQNGPVAQILNLTLASDSLSGSFDPASNVFAISPALATAIQNRQTYVNIHTLAFGGGELRGQVVPAGAAYFASNLFGSNEVPSIMTDAHGALMAELDGNQLVVTGSFADLAGDFDANIAGGSHLHNGLAGKNGGIEITLVPTLDGDLRGGVFEADSNTFTLTNAQVDLLEGRSLYANIHTTAFGSGELRGQVRGVAQSVYRAYLAGVNQPDPVLSRASGQVLLELDNGMLQVSGSFAGLESDFATNIAGGAHLHQGLAGQSGGIEVILKNQPDGDLRGAIFSGDSNVYAVDMAQMALLAARSTYINVHSIDNGGGEIRGQVLPEAAYVLNAYLSGSQENNNTISQATGAAKAEVRGDELVVSGSFSGLESDYASNVAGGAHLHKALFGSNGGIGVFLNSDLADMRSGIFASDSNTFSISTGMRDSLKARSTYVNIHSMDHPGGELRGQMLAEAAIYLLAPLSGASEVPPIQSNAIGGVATEIVGTRVISSGSFNGLSSAVNTNIVGGAHLHGARTGQNGSVLHLLNPTLAGDSLSGSFEAMGNVLSVTEGVVDSFMQRLIYVNLHTQNFGGGELRGNLRPLARAYFTTTLSGKSEVDPADTDASGAIDLELTGDKLTLSGSFAGLEGDFDASIAGGAHLHIAPVGANGGVNVLLNSELDGDLRGGQFLPDSNMHTLDSAGMAAIVKEEFYANIHTMAVASGELRGQILSSPNNFPGDAPMITTPGSGDTVNLAGLDTDPFMAQWSTASDANGNLLAYIWQLATSDDFDAPVINRNTGITPIFSTTLLDLDTLLENNGVNVGDTVTLYHRAIASDGALCAEGMADSIILIRGIVTDLDDNLDPDLRVKLFPSPAQDQLTLRIEHPLGGRYMLEIRDLTGRNIYQQAEQVPGGGADYALPVSQLPAGVYLLQLTGPKQHRHTLRWVKQ